MDFGHSRFIPLSSAMMRVAMETTPSDAPAPQLTKPEMTEEVHGEGSNAVESTYCVATLVKTAASIAQNRAEKPEEVAVYFTSPCGP